MTQEEINLLLKDLCGRLPYGVKLQKVYDDTCNPVELYLVDLGHHTVKFYKYKGEGITICDVGDIERFGQLRFKPYPFPLSSMTEEQKQEYSYIVNYLSPDDTDNWKECEFVYVDQMSELMHFFYKNHLDFRGLIKQDLTLDATGLNVY